MQVYKSMQMKIMNNISIIIQVFRSYHLLSKMSLKVTNYYEAKTNYEVHLLHVTQRIPPMLYIVSQIFVQKYKEPFVVILVLNIHKGISNNKVVVVCFIDATTDNS
jgi:hypothetical protein